MPFLGDSMEQATATDAREAALSAVDGAEWDVLVIGGGINGIAVFRELALQGARVLLAERSDFCSGASAASSHMVHGGLRYLENGEFRLVREAVRERDRLLQNAPHQVRPLPTVIPIFKRLSGVLNAPLKFLGLLSRPAERGAMVIKIGLSLYDRYARRHASRSSAPLPSHRFESRSASLRRHPRLNPDVVATATYYDGAMQSPERLGLEVLQDGTADPSLAVAFNYLAVAGTEPHNGKPAVLLRDESGREIRVQPRLIVNAAGPWIDFANRSLGEATRMIGGTKGSHLVLDHAELRDAIGEHEFFFELPDGRIVLLYPLAHRVLVGTSDLPIDDPDEARCDDEEVDYFLSMISHVFPNIEVRRSDIVFRFSGVRPLPRADAATPGQISRDHSIETLEATSQRPAVLNLVGGKWTTFRAFGATAADEALRRLDIMRTRSTDSLPIGGGADFPSPDQQAAWLAEHQTPETPRDVLAQLLQRYGSRALEVAAAMRQSGARPLGQTAEQGCPYYDGEILHLARHESVVHLEDLVLRRTLLAMLGMLDQQLLTELAELCGRSLGWSDAERDAEIRRTIQVLRDRHGVTLQ